MPEIEIKGTKVQCPRCSDYKKLVTITHAAGIIAVHTRTIFRYIQEGKVFVINTPGGQKRLCSGCLVKPDIEEIKFS